MSGFLLDTNVISELIRFRPDQRVAKWVRETNEELLHLSVLTLGEIRKGIALQPHASRKAALEAWLEAELCPRFAQRILPITLEVAERWGLLSAQASNRGRPVAVIDGLLAATAVHHNLTFVTRNTKDVHGVGVNIFDPWVEP